MARKSNSFVCQSCGAVHARWSGRCDNCNAWNTIAEESRTGLVAGANGSRLDLVGLQGPTADDVRLATGIAELDRVFGNGMVAGGATLISGDPGIGKSTLLIQAAAALAAQGATCAYVSGEESTEQVRLRAKRLGLAECPVRLAASTSVRDIITTFDSANGTQVLIVDSIQTMFSDNLDSAPGTVAQVRTAAQVLISLAKQRGIAVVLVGHVTKEGQIAGPRMLEHMVDTVLYFEGDVSHQFRILRAVKNRFGATDEIGVFAMTTSGLEEVGNPSALFLGERSQPMSGAAVFAGMEGTRPVLVEIEALVAPSPFGTPRRTVVGWDNARLAMILAVLDARCGLGLGGKDIFLNVAGGLKLREPAADLAVAAALISSFADRPVPDRSVVFGEVGLSGEIRTVPHTEARLREAEKLGFSQALVAPMRTRTRSPISVVEMPRLQSLIEFMIDDTTSAAQDAAE